jgi:hypothetical protein
VAKRDFACGDSCATFVDTCTQTYPSDVIEVVSEQAHSALMCDSVTSVRVMAEQVSTFGDDEDEIVPYVLPKMEENRAKVSAKPHHH